MAKVSRRCNGPKAKACAVCKSAPKAWAHLCSGCRYSRMAARLCCACPCNQTEDVQSKTMWPCGAHSFRTTHQPLPGISSSSCPPTARWTMWSTQISYCWHSAHRQRRQHQRSLAAATFAPAAEGGASIGIVLSVGVTSSWQPLSGRSVVVPEKFIFTPAPNALRRTWPIC